MVYFDNSATSYPKPKEVIDALNDYYVNCGANAMRSSHPLANQASEIVFDARRRVSRMMGIKNPMRVIWCFSATDALNMAIQGVVRKGWHVVTSTIEHNSTIRILNNLKDRGIITLDIIDIDDFRELIPCNTNLVVAIHASNINGKVNPIAELGAFCRARGIVTIIDSAQSAGILPISLEQMQIDIVAITAHKSLYGVQGVGAMLIADNFDYTVIKPLRQGGTGSLSESTKHPQFLPDIFESGTLNIGGLAALNAALKFIDTVGLESIVEHRRELTNHFITEATKKVVGFKLVSECNPQIGVVTFAIEGIDVGVLADMLSEDYKICSRAGLHCSPLAHKSIGSYPNGGVRFSFGHFNTTDEIDTAICALVNISNYSCNGKL